MKSGAGPLVTWFDDDTGATSELLGGKCLGLTQMTLAGLQVPPGFAVTTVAHRLCLEPALLSWLESPHLSNHHMLDGATPGNGAPPTEVAVLHDIAEHIPLAEAVHEAIAAAYAELGRRTGLDEPPVAVRSSGQIEDGEDASFAGQFDTYLWVVGTEAVVETVRRVWTGSLTASALSYRVERDLGFGFSPMSIAVQLMVDARSAGVMFTLDPRNGDRSRVVIESSWGLGEAVVAGEVQPDRFSVNKVTGDITTEEVGSKEHAYSFDTASGTVVSVPTETARREEVSLSEEEIRELTRLGRQLERLRGAPQDVEWAIDAGGEVYLLQVRPETVWSVRQPDAGAPRARGALECVVDLFGRSS